MKDRSIDLEKVLNDTNYTFNEHYSFRSVLGKGGFGVVVEAMSKATMEVVAVKVSLR